RADDRVRTGDLNLGKVPRYQLRYVREEGKSIAGMAYPPKCPNPQSNERLVSVTSWNMPRMDPFFGWGVD
ncbi:MAG: hypothetical protein RL589_184, partial [Actinomycetota bacterium]